MKKHAPILTVLFAAAAASAWSGCSSAPSAEGSDEQAATEASDCKIFSVQQQKILEGSELAAFVAEHKEDSVLKKILKDSCPGNFRDVQAKLTAKGCPGDTQVRVISERATMLNAPEASRALVSRTCDSSSLFFLLDPVENQDVVKECKAGIGPALQSAACKGLLPDDVEVIGEDKTNGVFTYYAREGAGHVWKFYGTSKDYVTSGYDCDGDKFNGACQPVIARDADKGGPASAKSGVRCASCHPGGGLVEKELNSPWISWMRPPGSSELTAAFSDVVGTLTDGDAFESTVGSEGINKTMWTPKRLELLKAKSVADKSAVELLRPLFCTIDINLQSTNSAAGQLTQLRNDFFLDPIWQSFSNVPITSAAGYANLLVANEQIIGDSNSEAHPPAQLKDLRDTFRSFMVPERSKLDQDYVGALISKGIVDEDFVKDVLFVDFTRPIYSPVRCDLLAAAEGITDLTPKGIHDAVLAAVSGTGTLASKPGASVLAAGLGNADKNAHAAAVTGYINKCVARGDALLPDAMEFASYLRRSARLTRVQVAVEKSESNPQGDFGIIDFAETLAVDKFERAATAAGKAADRPFFDENCVLKHAR